MAKKKVKTFTVDEETYDSLVTMFKENEAEVSVSHYVDRCLKDLLKYLKTLDELRRQKTERYTVPMSYVIDMVAREPKMTIFEYDDDPDAPFIAGEDELNEIQVRYEAEKKKIPLRFWRFLRTGRYKMSRDGEHIVNKRTGFAYNVDEGPWDMSDVPEHDEEPEEKE
ncbi:MAG: hypothetical protein A4E62_02372 [Syntrophorhabdus sp. PtaU1.Bin002]|nr:MAG: hypothetical protein A4E58_00084 [Syntrophorhabdus sp. PtaB.Bin006]OPY67018.1 MAG: hypothetical protein A4E62_02372 [Syntrophorhabdus sp. PtaU1.Bin002]